MGLNTAPRPPSPVSPSAMPIPSCSESLQVLSLYLEVPSSSIDLDSTSGQLAFLPAPLPEENKYIFLFNVKFVILHLYMWLQSSYVFCPLENL